MNRLEVMDQVVNCEACDLHEQCTAPVFMSCPEQPRLTIVGEAPGEQEDDQGRPFIGPAGQLLRGMLTSVDIDPDTCAYVNTVSCWPHGTPSWDHVRACADNKVTQLAFADTRYVLTVGKVAMKGFRPDLDVKHGRGRPWTQDGRLLFATYHPAAALRNGNYEAAMLGDLEAFVNLMKLDDDGRGFSDGERFRTPWHQAIPDTCSACPIEVTWIEDCGLGWCETHIPEKEMLRYREVMQQASTRPR